MAQHGSGEKRVGTRQEEEPLGGLALEGWYSSSLCISVFSPCQAYLFCTFVEEKPQSGRTHVVCVGGGAVSFEQS